MAGWRRSPRPRARVAIAPRKAHAGLRGAVVLALLLPHPTAAQVLTVSPSGGVTVFDGPHAFTTQGASNIPTSPITPPKAAQHSPLHRAASAADISADLVEAVAWRESHGKARVVSRAGAIGEMQLMPGTARALGVDPLDTEQNYLGGARYLSQMLVRYDGDLIRALAAYNAGPGAVDRHGGVPPYRETRAYVAAVLERLSRRAASGGAQPKAPAP